MTHCECDPCKRPRRYLRGRLTLPETSVGLDHELLFHRDSPDQHPINAITGLEETLETIPTPLRRITNKELEEMLT